MFYNKLKMDSLAEAVKKVMGEDDLDETGLRKAAYAAHKSGQTMFKFKGKTYPVKVRGEEVEAGEEIIDEASEKVPTPTGMKVYGHRYGNSAKARRDQTKRDIDTLKGPKDKEMKKELDEAGDCVTKPQAKDIAKKEVKGHEKQMHKEDEEIKSFKDRLLERAMTDAESKKKEKIVMSMKDKQSYFKKKYGKRWKEVMYATATKQAMKEDYSEDYEELDEATPAKNQDIADKAYLKHKPGTVKGTMTQLGRFLRGKPEIKEEEEIEEGNKSHTHAAHYENDKGEWTGMNLLVAKDDEDAIRQAHEKCKDGCRLSRVERHIPVKEELTDEGEIMETATTSGVVHPEKKTVDMLRGRVKVSGKYDDAKEHKSSKINLAQEEAEEKESYGSNPEKQTRAIKSIKAHDGLPEKIDRLDPKYGKPNSFDVHVEAKDPETSDAFGGQANFVTNAMTSSDEPKKKELSEVSVDEKVIAGTPGWEKIKGADPKGNVKDKSGAVHTPMSRARDLARQAFKKTQNEVLGIAPNNQTGV
jgi:hypothetical protein